MDTEAESLSLFDKIDQALKAKIDLGRMIASAIDYVVANYYQVFDFFSLNGEAAIQGLTSALLWIHPLVFVLAMGALAFAIHRRAGLVAFTVLGLLLIQNLGFWEPTIQTVALVLCATFVCVVIGVPIGIFAAHRPHAYTALRPVLDLMQTIPTFVYLIPALILFGLGVFPGLVSTVIFALPAPIRLTYEGIRQVPKDLLESGVAFGATRRQILLKIEIRHALPMIMAGVTQCIMLSLSMVVIAALVGADGLGKPVVRALNTVNIAMGFEAGLCIVILAILLDRLVRIEPKGGGRG